MNTPTATGRHDARRADLIDSLGMLLWKIGVLVVGLRMALVAPIHPTLLAWLARSVTLLLIGALALLGIGLLHLLWCAARWVLPQPPRPPAAFGYGVWRTWLRCDWPIPLAIDCALSAAIVLLAVTLAAHERLDWGIAAWLAAIGASRSLLLDQRQRAHARPARAA